MAYNDYPAEFDRRPPPALPVHNGYEAPSPTPTVNQMETNPDKLVEKGIYIQ
jgi:hypothetical protein